MENERNTKQLIKTSNGITLIALVITIIVLLILAAISIATLTGENGILTQANKAKTETDEKGALEEVQLEVMGSFDNNGNYSSSLAKTNLENNLKANVTDKGNGKLKVEYKGYTFNVDVDGKVSLSNGVDVGEIFDSTGEVEGKLHIGDFINYTAGTWDTDSIAKITASGAKNAPNTTGSLSLSNYQFGGFTNGSSRDGNAVPNDSSYNYVQETTSDGTKQAVTGWRVFDVSEDGVITLISAGCPEDYYHPSGTNYAYISEYILTGNVNTNASASTLGLGIAPESTYRPRDWSMYVNDKATSATALTKARLDEWYTKYTNTANANTYTDATFRKIYKTDANCVNNGMYESLIDNYSYYWLSSAYYSGVCYVFPCGRNVSSIYRTAFGVRILVSLSSDIQISEKSVGTKTITSRSNDYNYNIWNIE